MFKRIVAIGFIFICTSVAWAILGGTIFTRTYDSGSTSENSVVSTWGSPQNQSPPSAFFTQHFPRTEESTENGKKIVRKIDE